MSALYTFREFEPYAVKLPHQAGVIAWNMPKNVPMDSDAVSKVLEGLVENEMLETIQEPMTVFDFYRPKFRSFGILEWNKGAPKSKDNVMSDQSSVANRLGVVPAEALAKLSGLEFFKRMIAGKLPAPPTCAVSNQWLVEVDKGRIVWEASPPPEFVNPMGGVHGGWAMTVLDSALGCAVHSALPAGTGYTTVEVKINLTRAPAIGETYRCEGKLITLGRRIGTAEAKLIDGQGRVVAFGTTTCVILEV